MERFIDREPEMATLQREYERQGSALVILYGRRRVGKTTLISRFIRDKKALFFLASEESEGQNRNAFKEKAAEFIGSNLLKEADVQRWEVIFEAIADAAFDRKPVIVIDEFQYLGKANPAFPSIFQRIWEETLKDWPVMVILCGSLVSMMESQTLSYSSPLYGRRTAQIRLKQIPFGYYRDFFPDRSRREQIELYSVTGGVPKYIELFLGNRDVYQSIWDCVLGPARTLHDEPYALLQQEVAEVGSYFSAMKAIAAGNRKLSAISTALGVKATSLTKYLKTLEDLDVLEREVPITEENPQRSKKGLYRIKDNYMRFWFAFIYPNMSLIESGNSSIVMEKIQNGLISSHTAFIYEDVCRERMWDLNAGNCWPFHFSGIGRWWDKKSEIDIVAIDPEGGNIILGECKYWKTPVGANILRELEEKADSVGWQRGRCRVWYVLFGAAGFTEELEAMAAAREDLLLFDEGG